MRIRILAALIFLATGWAATAQAGSFEVAPTTLSLSADDKFGVFYITNRGAEPIVTQSEGFDWSQKDGADTLTPSTALIFSPPIVRLQPGQRQTIRLMVKPDLTAKQERSFRLVVSEIPDSSKRQTGAVHILLQFSVPIFVAAADTPPAQLVWTGKHNADGLMLNALNTGAQHAKLIDLAVKTPSDKITVEGAPFSYILAGASRSWQVKPSDATPNLANETHLAVTAHNEADDTAIDEPLLVQR